jgi:phage tail sheath protein FI
LADTDYIHGIRVVENTAELRVIGIPGTGVIGLTGTAPSAVASLVAEKPTVFFQGPEALKAIFPAGSTGQRGTLFAAAQAIFDQGSPIVVIVRSKSESLTDIQSAIDAFLEAESATGYKPEIICAPGHTGTIPTVPATPSAPAVTPATNTTPRT